MKKLFYRIYACIFAIPVSAVITIITALLIIILSFIFINNKLIHFIAKYWARIVSTLLLIRVKVYGKENVDPYKSYVFAANHQSLVDIFIIYGWLPNVFNWVMKANLIKIPFVGLACKAAGHIFIDRSTPLEANKSIEKAKQKLKNGTSIVIFPEGTRTYDGSMAKFKRGAFRIAGDLMLPIVPVTLKGSFERLKRSEKMFTPGKVEMYIHSPIDVKEYLPDNQSELMQKTWDVINSKL